jgi:FSR family fosmidomycin resistance protein-like MFS transporter
MWTLALLSAAHAVNHAQAVVLPLVYLAVIHEFGISVAAIAFLAAAGNIGSGLVQLSYSALTRVVSRRNILALGGVIFGGGMAGQALAGGFVDFAAWNLVSRIAASPQHPVGNALLSEQFAPERRGVAISAHIAGGNIGTVAVPLVGAGLIASIGWRPTVVIFGVPAIVVAVVLWLLVGESGADRAAARAYGSLRSAFSAVLRDRDLVLVFTAAAMGGGARGLAVLNIFVPLYLSLVLHLDTNTVALMYTVLVVGSVPGPIVAGWLSDRVGRKPIIVAAYLFGALALAAFVLAGSNLPLLWLAIVLLSIFNFVESPQLQALLSDLAPAALRDASFSLYFTLAFGVGSIWVAVYGAVVDVLGNDVGLPAVFWLMAVAFIAAIAFVLPIRAPATSAEPSLASPA